MKVPVLILAFNRPDHVRKAMEAVRTYQPSRLYLACDGPRDSKEGEAALVLSVQQTIQSTVEGKKQELIESNMQSADVQAQIRSIVDSKINEVLAQKLPAAKDGQKSIQAAIEQLGAYNQFYQGILAYTNGVQSLYDGTAALQSGAQQLSDGLDKLSGSTDALTDGIARLNNGAMQLSDGMKQFREGSLGRLASLSGGSAGDLSARFKALRDVSEAYRSYTGLPEGESGKVKFIYRTDSVEAPDAE